MIVVTMERRDGTLVARLAGCFGASDDPRALAADMVASAGSSPLVVDLHDLDLPMGAEVDLLVASLAGSRIRSTTALVHPDLEVRRTLRAASGGLPVVPDRDQILQGCFASGLVARGSSAPD
jgi:hypothetical protein